MLGASDFETWYRQEHPRVLGALTVVAGNPDVASDATAEAFVRAYERWERVRSMASPGGWLYRVALNIVRRRARRLAMENELLRRRSPAIVEAPPLVQPEVWDAVRSLPRQQRVAIALRYVLDLPEADVAQLMGVSRGSASATLTTARRRLAETLAWPETDLERIGHG